VGTRMLGYEERSLHNDNKAVSNEAKIGYPNRPKTKLKVTLSYAKLEG
jgi:hypothetical protein